MDRTASGVARCIRLAREGQEDALNDLLSAYRAYLRLLASTCIDPAMREKADPSDVVQDALLKAHTNFHQFRGTTEQEWIGWVRSILARSLADLHRRYSYKERAVARERSLDALLDRSSLMLRSLVATPEASPGEAAEERETGVLLADALEELQPDDRDVVMLRSLHEMDWNEVARRMRRTPDAARMLWTRAIRRLGDVLRERLQ